MKDAKYLWAYLIPASAVSALWLQGGWTWATLILAFMVLPIVELITPAHTANTAPEAEEARSKRLFFDILLYLNAPLLFGIVGYYLYLLSVGGLSSAEITGLSLSVGIVVGTCGINVAHELGHRTNPWEQRLARWMLLPALYQHFFIEHNLGHHKHVATDQDPATARFGEPLYPFWLRSVSGSWRNAWALEATRLQKAGLPVASRHNMMLRFTILQMLYLSIIGYLGGGIAVLGALSVAIVGILLLETVNYLEHYGLRRRMLPSGRPEPVSPAHSWNSNHELGRIFLYELTRHSDHHYKATRKYQVLRHLDESPQLPFGYPTCILIALLPPLWFAVMNPKVLDFGRQMLNE